MWSSSSRFLPAAVAVARTYFDAHGAELKDLANKGKSAGAIHHRYGAGNGEFVIVDEWKTREACEKFFNDPAIATVMANAGASGPPAIAFYEGLATAF